MRQGQSLNRVYIIWDRLRRKGLEGAKLPCPELLELWASIMSFDRCFSVKLSMQATVVIA